MPSKKLRERPAGEIVILILASCAGVLIISTGVTLIITFVLHPEEDLTEVARGIADIINTIVGALIGYLAGTSIQKGKNDQDPPDPPTS